MNRLVTIVVVALSCLGAQGAGVTPPPIAAGRTLVVERVFQDGAPDLVLRFDEQPFEGRAAEFAWERLGERLAFSAHPDGVHLDTGNVTIVGERLVLRWP